MLLGPQQNKGLIFDQVKEDQKEQKPPIFYVFPPDQNMHLVCRIM